MKSKNIPLALIILFLFFGCAHTPSWRQMIAERNEMSQYVRKNIIEPSIFPFKVVIGVNFKNPAKYLPLESVKKSCGNFGAGAAFVINENGDLLTVKHNIHNKMDMCEKAIQREITTQKLPVMLGDITISAKFFIIGQNGQDYPLNVIKESPDKDIAIVRVADKIGITLKPLSLYQRADILDEEILVVGTPVGIKNAAVYGHTARDTLTDGGILFSTPVYPGNSGGPLFSLEKMEVIGMVTNAITAGNGQILNYGIAMPASEIREFLETR